MSELTFTYNLNNPVWARAELRVWINTTLGMIALLLVCLVAGQFDDRLLHGVSVWTKPAKFALSLAVYFATLLWFTRFTGSDYFRSGNGRALVWVPVVAAWIEMAYIFYQASLGEPSHFNVGTPFHATMYTFMGIGAVTLVSVLVWYGIVIVRRSALGEPMVLAVVVGLVMTFVLGGGFGSYLSSMTGHWVDAPASDAGGTMLFNWSRQGGDLRVAHFFGMHAMQALPLFACLLHRNWSIHIRRAGIVAFACAYAAFTIMTFVQAVNGIPFGG